MSDTTTTPASTTPANTAASAPTATNSAATVSTPAQSIITPAASSAETVTAPTPAPADASTTGDTSATASISSPAEGVVAPDSGTLMGEGGAKIAEDAKKDATATEAKIDVKPEGEAQKPAEAKIELPTYEAFKLPENTKADDAVLGEFSKLLGEIEIGKLDHKGFQESGQKLVDLHTKALSESINKLNDYYVQIHNHQKAEWMHQLKSDAELGGTHFGETASAVNNAIENYSGSAEQQAALRKTMEETGLGNHPNLVRLVANMQKKIDSYTKESAGANRDTAMVPGSKPAPTKVKDYQRFYGSN